MKITAKEIDFKSLIIGFLLAAVIFLLMGASPASSGTRDVRIVGISSSVEIPVKINDVGYSVKIPVEIKNQPIEIKTK